MKCPTLGWTLETQNNQWSSQDRFSKPWTERSPCLGAWNSGGTVLPGPSTAMVTSGPELVAWTGHDSTLTWARYGSGEEDTVCLGSFCCFILQCMQCELVESFGERGAGLLATCGKPAGRSKTAGGQQTNQWQPAERQWADEWQTAERQQENQL